MIDFYLVTGFLGAGKTTFLKRLVRQFSDRRIYLIINEFGSQGVDGELVRELGLALAEINNGSIFCACRLDKFEAELHNAIKAQPDIIITEASGLSDPTNVRKVLSDFPMINYKGSICLADAARLVKVFSTAEVSRRQLAVSSLVLINKIDLASEEQIEQTEGLILEANPAAKIKHCSYGELKPEWLSLLSADIYLDEVLCSADITLQKVTLQFDSKISRTQLDRCIAYLTESCYRIKGFIMTTEGAMLVDCTGPQLSITPWGGKAGGQLVLLAGKGMPLRKAVLTAIEWYPDLIKKET